MLRVIIHEGMVDEDVPRRAHQWLGRRCKERSSRSLPRWRRSSAAFRPQRSSPRRGSMAAPTPSLIMHARGIEHSTHGVDNCLACINLALARGQVGKPGGGTTMLTGQGNGQGGREVGQKASQLPGYRHIDVRRTASTIADVWGIPDRRPAWEGAAATEMVHLMASGEIKSCLVVCSNLMVSLPDNTIVAEGAGQSRPADRDGLLHVGDGRAGGRGAAERGLVRGRRNDDQPGGPRDQDQSRGADRPARPARDWEIVTDLAHRMGRGKFFPFKTRPRDLGGTSHRVERRRRRLLRDHLGEDRSPARRLLALSHRRTIPAPRGCSRSASTTRMAKRGCSRSLISLQQRNQRGFPFRLTTGRVVYHYLSGNQTRRLDFLNAAGAGPLGGDSSPGRRPAWHQERRLVRVRTPRNSMELKALVVPTIRPDTLFIPFHYGHRHAVNQLTNPAVDETVKIPEYKVCAATIEKLGNDPPAPDGRPKQNYSPGNRPKCSRMMSVKRRTELPTDARGVQAVRTADSEGVHMACQDDVSRSIPLHWLPCLRGGLPRVRLAQGREHDHGRFHRPWHERRHAAHALHALPGSGGALRPGMPGAGDPASPRKAWSSRPTHPAASAAATASTRARSACRSSISRRA